MIKQRDTHRVTDSRWHYDVITDRISQETGRLHTPRATKIHHLRPATANARAAGNICDRTKLNDQTKK
jgi:hypothetical protein